MYIDSVPKYHCIYENLKIQSYNLIAIEILFQQINFFWVTRSVHTIPDWSSESQKISEIIVEINVTESKQKLSKVNSTELLPELSLKISLNERQKNRWNSACINFLNLVELKCRRWTKLSLVYTSAQYRWTFSLHQCWCANIVGVRSVCLLARG